MLGLILRNFLPIFKFTSISFSNTHRNSLIHIAVFATPSVKRRFRYIVLPADRLNRTITVGLPQDADNLLSAMFFLFHQTTPLRVRNSLS